MLEKVFAPIQTIFSQALLMGDLVDVPAYNGAQVQVWDLCMAVMFFQTSLSKPIFNDGCMLHIRHLLVSTECS